VCLPHVDPLRRASWWEAGLGSLGLNSQRRFGGRTLLSQGPEESREADQRFGSGRLARPHFGADWLARRALLPRLGRGAAKFDARTLANRTVFGPTDGRTASFGSRTT